MKKLVGLLLMCLLCACACLTCAAAEGPVTLDLANGCIDIYPNGYKVETSQFVPYTGAYIIKGSSIDQDTALDFHANEFDTDTNQTETENDQTAEYSVMFEDVVIVSRLWCTAIRFGNDEKNVENCSITLNLINNSANGSVLAHNWPAFANSFNLEDNSITVNLHNRAGSSLKLDRWDDAGSHIYGANTTFNVDGLSSVDNSTKIEITVNSCQNHLQEHPQLEATCETDGNKPYWECTECEAIFSDKQGNNKTTREDVILPALGHSLKHVPAKAPTCMEDGYEEHWRCEVCGKLYADESAATQTTEEAVKQAAHGHKLKAIEGKEPTYMEEGYEPYWVCTVCGQLFADANGAQPITEPKAIEKLTAPTPDNPQTGDSSNLLGWAALLGVSCVGIVIAWRRKRA